MDELITPVIGSLAFDEKFVGLQIGGKNSLLTPVFFHSVGIKYGYEKIIFDLKH